MPLSEDEQRQLDQIERDLAQEHEFAVALPPGQRRRVILAAALLAVGMTLMLTGVVTMHTAAVLGAVISVAAMLAIVSALTFVLAVLTLDPASSLWHRSITSASERPPD